MRGAPAEEELVVVDEDFGGLLIGMVFSRGPNAFL
jgi:hypothetical protein